MNKSIQLIVRRLEEHIQMTQRSGNKYDFIDKAHELCMELETLGDAGEAIEPLFRCIERSPDIDYGGPGPIGQFLEAFDGGIYEKQLLHSLQRKPTLYTIHLLDILLQDSNDPRQALYLDTMRAIAANVVVSDTIRKEAINNLRYALENLSPWTAELRKEMIKAQAWIDELMSKEAADRETLQQEEPPPLSTVSYKGISFQVITRGQAKAYMPALTDLPDIESKLDDPWDDQRFPIFHENAYFLLTEENITIGKLELGYKIPDRDDIIVLGFIFTGSLQVQSHILAFDTSSSPALIVHGEVHCPCIHLLGNRHYIGGNVTTDVLWTKYNQGELYINGSIDAQVILADTMPVFIRQCGRVGALISRMGMNIYCKTGNEWLQQPATHDIEELFLPTICITNEDGDTVLNEAGANSAIAYIKAGKPLLK